MRLHMLTYVLGMALATSAGGLAQTPATKIAPQKGWLNDLNAARAVAHKTGKPLMVVFRCDP